MIISKEGDNNINILGNVCQFYRSTLAEIMNEEIVREEREQGRKKGLRNLCTIDPCMAYYIMTQISFSDGVTYQVIFASQHL